MTLAPARLHHVAITVTDLEASTAWYARVLGLEQMMEVPHPGGLGRVMTRGDLAFVLHRHDANSGEPFHETRTGLDHPGLAVPTREDLVAWSAHLAANGVTPADAADRPCTQSPIADEPYGSVLVFRDPDNIQLELVSLAASAD